MWKGSNTSKSLGDLPEFKADDRVFRKDKGAAYDDSFEDHWTDSAVVRTPTVSEKDLFDDEPLPEPETRTTTRGFTLFKRGGSLTAEGEKLRPSKYGTVKDATSASFEQELEQTAFSSQNTKKRERSSSFGGRIKSAFSIFSSKYEAVTFGKSIDGLANGDEDLPIQSDEKTEFRGVHYSKQERGSKRTEEHIVSAVFSMKGVFLEEQPSGDYVDDISPSVVTKYLVDPKVGSFNLIVNRKSRYSSTTQVEYTVILTSKYFEHMMTCWKEIAKVGEPLSPRGVALVENSSPPPRTDKKKKEVSSSLPIGRENPPRTPFDDDYDDFPYSPTSRSKERNPSSPRDRIVSPRGNQQPQSPPKQDLLIDI